MSTLAIAWVLRHPRCDAAIIGPRTAAQLDTTLASSTVALSHTDAARLANLFSSRPRAITFS